MSTKRTIALISRNPDTLEEVQRNFASANPAATVANVDTFLRSVNALTDNTFVDGLIIDTKSTTEELAAQGGN